MDAFLSGVHMAKPEDPDPSSDMRTLLVAWLDWQRATFRRKTRDLDASGLAEWSVPPVELSILGLIRHMTDMEHVYLTWGLGGGERREVYGEDDFAGGSAGTVAENLQSYLAEVERADAAIARLDSLESEGLGHGRPLGATLVKMTQEYAVHNGQAHMLRYAVLGEVRR